MLLKFIDKNSKYCLDDGIIFGKDYPSGYPDMDIFHILTLMKMGEPLDKIFSNLKLESSFHIDMMRNILIDQKLINAIPVDMAEDEMSNLSASELSEMLQNMGITASGKKKLLKLMKENFDKINIASGEYEVSGEGENFLNEFSWIGIYDYCLDDYFDFNDYYKFIDEHDGDYDNLAITYLDNHIKLAHEKQDFLYLNNCYESKVIFYLYNEELELALDEEIKNFIIRLNPLYDYSDVYKDYDIFDFKNINNIKELSESLNLDIKELYCKNWDCMNLENEFISKEEGFKILEMLLSSYNLIDISKEYKEYLKIK